MQCIFRLQNIHHLAKYMLWLWAEWRLRSGPVCGDARLWPDLHHLPRSPALSCACGLQPHFLQAVHPTVAEEVHTSQLTPFFFPCRKTKLKNTLYWHVVLAGLWWSDQPNHRKSSKNTFSWSTWSSLSCLTNWTLINQAGYASMEAGNSWHGNKKTAGMVIISLSNQLLKAIDHGIDHYSALKMTKN